MADETYGLLLDVDYQQVQQATAAVEEAEVEIYKFATVVRDANQDASKSFTKTTAEVYAFADAEEQSAEKVRHAKMSLEEYIATQIKVADSQRTLAVTAGATASRFGNMNTMAQQAAYGLGDFASASGGLGAKLMAVSNNVQFVTAQFGPWGAALGLVVVGIAAAIKNADQFSGLLNDQYIKPDVINRTAQLTDEIHANEKAFEKLRDKTALSAAELKEFNRLQAEGVRLQREKAYQDELDRQKKEKTPETERRAKNAQDAFKQVGAAQAQHDIEELLIKANPGMSRDLARQQAEALRANAGLGQKQANEFLELLFGSKAGGATATGLAFNGMPGTADRADMEATSREQRKVNERHAAEALDKARKQFGAQAWLEWQALNRKQRDRAFQPGDKEHDAFRRWAQARGERLIAEAEADPQTQNAQKRIDARNKLNKFRAGTASPAEQLAHDKKERDRREKEAHADAKKTTDLRDQPVLKNMVALEKRSRELEKKGMSMQAALMQAIQEMQANVHTIQEMQALQAAAVREIRMTNQRQAARNRSNWRMGN